MSMMPATGRPRITQERARALLDAGGARDHRLAILGLRGYFRDSMGRVGENDRGIYDDAIVVVSPSAFVAFNANTDPSQHREAMASLAEGLWKYRLGVHGLNKPKDKQYMALVQAEEVVVHRDGTGGHPAGEWHPQWGRSMGGGRWRGWFGINIHRGGYTTTSSLGCNTLYPDQWPAFIALVEQEMRRENTAIVPYLLISYQG